jgi:predicted transcriptional regulator
MGRKTDKKKVTVAVSLDPDLAERIEVLIKEENRSRSNMYETLLLQALDGNGTNIHPRIAELAGDWLRGLVTAEELAREVAALVLAPPAVSDKQMALELPVTPPA